MQKKEREKQRSVGEMSFSQPILIFINKIKS